jgi:N-sulfoglucosamine sulfohydrolase
MRGSGRDRSARLAGIALLPSIALAGCGRTASTSRSTGTHDRLNFVVIVADDVAWDDIGAFGHPTIRTPNLDVLARMGLRFTNAFLTTSSCSPARCSILTGRYPHSTGAADLHDPLPSDQVTFVERLREAGYYTASAGKWHMGNAALARFDRVRREAGVSSGAEFWLQTIRERPPDRPYFLWLASLDAHLPHEKGTIPEPYRLADVVVPGVLPDLPEIRADLALYYEEVSRLDDNVGAVLTELASPRNDARHTVVIFLSDGGRPFPGCKATVYDRGVKTPLIIRLPEVVKAGAVSASLVSTVDIAPTILDLAGLPIPKTMQGVTFAPVLRDPAAEVRTYVVAEQNWHDYAVRQRAIRTKTMEYIRNFYPELPDTPPADTVRARTYQMMERLRDGGRLTSAQMNCFVHPRAPEELYDVLADPEESRNLAGDPERRPALRDLAAMLTRWQTETEDATPRERRPDEYDRETGARLPGVQPRAHADSHITD